MKNAFSHPDYRKIVWILLSLSLCAAGFACSGKTPAAVKTGASTPHLVVEAASTPSPEALPAGTPGPAAELSPEAAGATSPEPEAPVEPTPVPTPFSIVWFPDTQTAAWSQPDCLYSMGKYVADNFQEKNILYVWHTGDLVENGYKPEEWAAFNAAYDCFKEDVPFLSIAGNHDLGVKTQTYDGYLAQPCAQTVPDGQQYENGKGNYILLDAGGVSFIVLGIGYNAGEGAIDWANQVLETYRDRVAILLFHGYLHARKGIYEEGVPFYQKIVKTNSNVRLVLCGHYRGTAFRTDKIYTDGPLSPMRTVNTMLCNFQGSKGYNAMLRLLTFDPANRTITVDTFNTMIERSYPDDTLGTNPFVIYDAF